MICNKLAEIIYESDKSSVRQPNAPIYAPPQRASDRWNNILLNNDDKQLWKSINWKGTFDKSISTNEQPSSAEFCTFFESLLNSPNATDPREYTPEYFKYIPILDDPIEPTEVLRCVRKLKPNKAAGVDWIQVDPGVLKILPDNWILAVSHVYFQPSV